jgi:hypothetical protein
LGLTEAKTKDLKDKKFDELYKKHKAKWQSMAQTAYDFAKTNISKGAEPLPDDVLKPLLSMLEVDEDLRKHQEVKHAKYSRYRESFGEYIVEEHIKTQPAAEGGANE